MERIRVSVPRGARVWRVKGRQNDITLQGCRVLRLPLLGLRVAREEFFAQIEQALVDAGWRSRWSA
jgi:hypothetical protein